MRVQAVRVLDLRHAGRADSLGVRQGVASGGVVCRVASTLARTFRGDRRWALAHAGHPRTDPTGPASLNPVRHRRTVGRKVSQRWAIALSGSPSAAGRQIRDRSTTRRGLVFARIHASTVCVCAPVIGNESVGFHLPQTIPDPPDTKRYD